MCKVVAHQQWAQQGTNKDAASEKLRISLSRTRSTIEQILYSNEFSLFITMTILNDTQGCPPTREEVEAHMKKRMRALRRANKAPIQYLLIPEMSDKGRWHIHGVLGGVKEYLLTDVTGKKHAKPCYMYNRPKQPFRCYNIPLLSKGAGHVLAEEIVQDSGPDGLGYLISYLCKNMYVDKYPHESYKHRIIVSRGLQRPKPIYTGEISESEYTQLRRMAQTTQDYSSGSTLLLARQDVESLLNTNAAHKRCVYRGIATAPLRFSSPSFQWPAPAHAQTP